MKPNVVFIYAMGKSLRDKCPCQSHAAWKPLRHRRDRLELLEESSRGRIAALIPIRNGLVKAAREARCVD
jgi:hypothetical protein